MFGGGRESFELEHPKNIADIIKRKSVELYLMTEDNLRN